MADFDIINAALTRTGNEPITSYEDGTPGADIASTNYESVVGAELGSYPWKWASKSASLGATLTDDPALPWAYNYQLPPDFVAMRVVRWGGMNGAYDIVGQTVVSNYDADLVVHYTWRVPEVRWPPMFAEAVRRRMEAVFLRGIGERHAEARGRDQAAEIAMAQARRVDAQSIPGRNPYVSGTLAARRA